MKAVQDNDLLFCMSMMSLEVVRVLTVGLLLLVLPLLCVLHVRPIKVFRVPSVELLMFVPLGMYCVLVGTENLEVIQLVLNIPEGVIYFIHF